MNCLPTGRVSRAERSLGVLRPTALSPVLLFMLAALALVLGGCGSSSSTGSATSSPSPGAGRSPDADVVQAAPVKHVTVGDLVVGYRAIGPLAGPAAAPASQTAAAAGSSPQAVSSAEPPLFLIMGSSGTMDEWPSGFVAALAQDRTVVLFDNRGIGETNDPAGAYPFRQLADDTAGLITALGYDRADVLGWSMGGQVAVDLAVRHPQEVGRLISYAGDAGASKALPPTKAALAVLMDTPGSARARGERLIALLFPAAYRAAHPDYAASFPIPRERAAPAAIALQNKAIATWSGVWNRLKDISCPVLFVTGTRDVISPAQNALMMAEQVPSSWLVRFAGAGHGLMYQEPQQLAATVLSFLQNTSVH